MRRIYRKIAANDILAVLSSPPYLSFTLSVVFSQIAFNMMNIVLIFILFYITSSSFSVSMLILTFLLPQVFLSFLGGVIADMKNKKKILIIGNVLRGLLLIILFLNPDSVFFIFLFALLISTITQFYMPAETPLIPHLVKKDQLLVANSVFGVSLFGSILIGYVLAGPGVSIFGQTYVFLFIAALFFLSAVFATLLPDSTSRSFTEEGTGNRELIKSVTKSVRGELKASLYLLKATGNVASSFFFLIFSQVGILILATVIPDYAKNVLMIPPESVSLLLFAPAAGGMIVASVLLGSALKKVSKNVTMNIGIFLSGIVLCFFPFTSQTASAGYLQSINNILPFGLELTVFPIVFLIAFLAGFGNAFIFVPSQVTLQEKIPDNFRSKIYGLLFSLIGVFSLGPILLAGSLADVIGVGSVLIGLGAFIILIGITRVGLQPARAFKS